MKHGTDSKEAIYVWKQIGLPDGWWAFHFRAGDEGSCRAAVSLSLRFRNASQAVKPQPSSYNEGAVGASRRAWKVKA
ncbi:hypothetical protein THAOC_14300, partial [Thalassiosira oceanica]